MYSLYGFVGIPNFKDNGPGKTATIGELEDIGFQYSTEVGTYRTATYSNVVFHSIDSRRDEVLVDVGLTYYDTILHIAQWLYDRSIQGAVGQDSVALKQALTAEFGYSVEFVAVGPILLQGHYYYPSSMEIKVNNSGETNDLFVWFANDAFLAEYPGKEFRIVPALEPVDQFFNQRDAVLAMLKAITSESHNAKVQAAIGKKPQSYIWTKNFNWHDIDNEDVTWPAPFTAIINGQAGVNIDYIKEAIRAYILANSEHTESEWAKVLPEIFTPTEFYIVPIWDRYSLPNQALETGVYSPTIPYSDQMTYALKYFKGYLPAHITANLCISSCSYQSLQFLSCGNQLNYGADTRFDREWPQYANVPVVSAEFAKLPPDTQTFITKLVTLLMAAEVATPQSIIPTDMTRTQRDGVYYLTTTVGAVQYLVPIKQGFALS